MKRLAVGFAVIVALATPTAAKLSIAADLAVPFESMPIVQRCVVTSLTVDGLPVLQHGWCSWDNDQRLWVPMGKDLERKRVIDIIPLED